MQNKTQNIFILRCAQCNKKLAEGIFTFIEIKCPRCKCVNKLKADELHSD